MFGLFKNKDKQKPTTSAKISEPTLTEEEKASLLKEVEALRTQAEATNDSDKEAKAKLYEKIGLKQAELTQNEEAITSLEKSLEYKLSIGDGYKKLMNLYNAKRAESARSGNDEGIEYYMNKMDDMRQIAKKVTTSR
ncbi:tetratricopeptide repeat protein [Marinilactibacillus sp. XAAS-LB27]|uniref:tetratricopeptide repeat protein n=1 Tax=Marinilactibacillus sp. XAAS-LB27 TaxID=3114538 RepID=UPI002E17322E|nr:tetratricopeptide repeat protein [Marinilactibacillus sp. XAAS-LB27]